MSRVLAYPVRPNAFSRPSGSNRSIFSHKDSGPNEPSPTRSASPTYGLIILNRKDLNNLVQPLTQHVEFHLNTPFLLYKKLSEDLEDGKRGMGVVLGSKTLHQSWKFFGSLLEDELDGEPNLPFLHLSPFDRAHPRKRPVIRSMTSGTCHIIVVWRIRSLLIGTSHLTESDQWTEPDVEIIL
ncbi:hypothetical protein RRG08_052398 [Elysia crispata]|uniref:Uncharacterized protein n=1 Tax=Elysia crispata TaxID=231223 RepID=A0AAE1B151_9GAST|nr:hypothetical protein RRG08_052398 [Elysia crispata]